MTSITQWSRAEQRLEQERIALAELIAEAWNAAGINYAVLHGLEAYPSGPLGRDLDILVEASQRWQALQLAVSTWRGKGWSVCRHRKPWVWQLFAFRRHSAGISALEIDLKTDFRWGPRFLVRVPQPAQWRGPFAVDPWASVVKQIILPVLSNRMERLQEQPSKLSRDPGEQAALHARLPRFVGKSLSEELVAVLEKTDIEQLRRLAPSLRRAFLRRSLLGRPLECVRASLAWVRDEGAERMSLRCAPTFSVEGPDGVGKSTALEQVGHQVPRFFTQIVIKHWRPGLLPRLGHLLGRSADSAGVPMPPRRTAGKFGALRLAYYGVDFILGSYLLDGRDSSLLRLVLYDRWAMDMMVDPYRYGLRASRGTRLFWKLVPKPDRAILLFDSPDRIVARKAELEKDEIERQLREWLRLARRGHVDAVIRVDAPPEELARRITDLVITSFIEKNGGDLTARIRAEERLREMVAALGGGGGVELCFDGGKDRLLPSGRNDYSTPLIAVLPSATKPRLLIPLHNRKASAAALRVYNPQKRLARLAKRLLAATLRLGLAQPLLRPRASLFVPNGDAAVTPPDFALQEHLREVFGVKQLVTSISLGTPGVHQKPLIQAM
ncbi:MAG: hypothetical protein IH935_12720, partial [Acidobacteria bacterium]|nr:hypothetical protein [Acidobacteriota bacterium]